MFNVVLGVVDLILIVTAGIILVDNHKIQKKREELVARYEATENRRKLREYQKRRMCEHYCKFRDSAETQEQLDSKCWDCPVGEL